jgi:3-methyladenine DNA glycosylase AlkD/peptidoglycan/xylan/chitin deacetylase (PgdA/CDA1 family)
MEVPGILAALRAQANPANVAGMARYGISTNGTLGVPVKSLRKLAKSIGRDHRLALDLWDSGIHEARILATIIDDPALVTKRQMDRWARDFDSWDVCDQACQNLFRYTPHAWEMAAKWSAARPEFVRRAAFALMAGLAVKAKAAPRERFEAFLPLIAAASTDRRNMVKKSVAWARRCVTQVLLLLISLAGFAQTRQVAITIDDLPRGGDSGDARDLASIRALTTELLDPLRGIPVIGFVNAGPAEQLGAPGLQAILKLWLDAGATLGNHTWSHPDLNTTPLAEYEADLLHGKAAVAQAAGRPPVYFRHPFLHAGKDAATRRGLEEFLAEHHYRIAPVTLDNSDWMFAAVYAPALKADPALAARVRETYLAYMDSIFAFFEQRTREVVGRDIPQILLIHASRLNADSMPALLAMMRRRGYQFISLNEALKDPAYSLPDNYYGTGGFSWIHRWSRTKGMPNKGEPDEPGWIAEAYRNLQKVQ